MKVYLDTNFIISLLVKTEFTEKAKKISQSLLRDAELFVGMNTVEETTYVLMRVLKIGINKAVKMLENFLEEMEVIILEFLPFDIYIEVSQKYRLLPNDALIAATCKYYGIKKIATFDEDFEKVDFLEVVKL